MDHFDKHYVEILQEQANKPKGELLEILDKLEKVSGTKTRVERLEKIIQKIESWQRL